MGHYYFFGFIIGAAVVLVIGLIIHLIYRTQRIPLNEYDERQLVIRGNGFKYAFFTVLIGNLVFAAVSEVMKTQIFTPSTGYFASVMAAFLVFLSYCIWNDAYLTRNEKPVPMIIIFAVVGGINLLLGVLHIVDGTFIENGRVSDCIINLICGIVFVVLALVGLSKEIQSRREAD